MDYSKREETEEAFSKNPELFISIEENIKKTLLSLIIPFEQSFVPYRQIKPILFP